MLFNHMSTTSHKFHSVFVCLFSSRSFLWHLRRTKASFMANNFPLIGLSYSCTQKEISLPVVHKVAQVPHNLSRSLSCAKLKQSKYREREREQGIRYFYSYVIYVHTPLILLHRIRNICNKSTFYSFL